MRDVNAPFTMLIDCGDVHIGTSRPDGRRTTAADYLRGEGVRALDLLVLTHLHLDHAGGLAHLLPGVWVQEFWTNYLPPEEVWGCPLSVPPDWPAGARCLMTSMGIYLKALAHLRDQGTEIRLIGGTCDHRQLTELLATGIFLEDQDLQKRQAAIWSTVFSASALVRIWTAWTALSTTPASACGCLMPGRRLSCLGMCMLLAGNNISFRPAPL